MRPALALPLPLSWSASAASQAKPAFERSAGDLDDRIRGGLRGRIFGNLGGLPLEMKKGKPRDWKETRGHIEEKHTDHGGREERPLRLRVQSGRGQRRDAAAADRPSQGIPGGPAAEDRGAFERRTRARSPGLAMALAESERLRKDRPADWKLALEELKMFPKVWRRIYDAPQPQVARIQAAAWAEGRPQKPGK